MKRYRSILLLAPLLFSTFAAAHGQGELQLADLGRCVVESGQAIEPCRIGYRTFGTLNADRSNAVLVTTSLIGTTEHLLPIIGPDKMLDTSKHYVIAVDALGNGVSSSPSNSEAQTGEQFPSYTIRDMVRSQQRLLQEVLGIERLHAVVGNSMGGMQALEWAVSYPHAVKKVVSTVGSPRLTSYDLLVWETMLRAIEASEGCSACDPMAVYAPLAFLVLQTPEYRVRETPQDSFPAFLETIKGAFRTGFRGTDVKSQLRAMMAHNVSAPYGGSLERAADRVQADVLMIVSERDHAVRPEPALEFARLLGAEAVLLDSDCGHQAFYCESNRIASEVRAFLDRQSP